MKPEEYRSKTTEELEKLIKDLKLDMAISYGHHETSKVRAEHRNNFRKEIARIMTIIQEKEAKKKDDTHNS